MTAPRTPEAQCECPRGAGHMLLCPVHRYLDEDRSGEDQPDFQGQCTAVSTSERCRLLAGHRTRHDWPRRVRERDQTRDHAAGLSSISEAAFGASNHPPPAGVSRQAGTISAPSSCATSEEDIRAARRGDGVAADRVVAELNCLRSIAEEAWRFVSQEYECDTVYCTEPGTTETSGYGLLCDEHRPKLSETQDAYEVPHADLYRLVRAWRSGQFTSATTTEEKP